MKLSRIIVPAVFVMLFMTTGCGKSGLEDVDIPDYPGAVEDQAFNMGNMAKVKRVFTTDSYEEVIAFYTEELAQYEPEIQSYDLKDSRQTKIDVINEEKRVVSVVVQEFAGEDRVAIVYMGVSL